ncbi:mechanosensitive ion channel family protein [Burkholderia thailandensis]|uniref:Mechanosensitive ion channel family protein n=5 Tax=Burkholderia thailandensis TaxID=57975 RepID=A0AAW9D6D2_BURTH|nr:mechanosensitive ion channel domain-containing protein [Burkholderia thailandensis]ABC37772.1 mechanosensitive ion channel family protein [Burkholderia thailandensis E264]AHI65516.1 mechanosensitive ion channel family protein [Burkholderia thailandensis H0587]AHI73879.1 mechanosensitive ion channel family protein [Burkholderia thailandensis 2002721723]AHI78619.1 mechanosensitive ion channel family protein [Burkholderia thailandensis E444]AIC88911.1 mechanosensitive ion channel family protei
MLTIDDLWRIADAPLHTWLGTLVVSALVLLAVAGIHRIGARIVVPIARPYPFMSVIVSYIDRPSLALLSCLALEFLWLQADTLPHAGGLRTLAAVGTIAALTWLLMRLAAAVGDAIIRAHPIDTPDNLEARRIHTQTRVLARTVMVLIVVIGTGAALMTFPNVRQVGASLLASAGVAGLVAGIAARPVLGNLIAGLQIALSQPIRLDDVVIIQGEWGRIEEITGTYVSVRLWDQRRLVVPLQWFIENPFQNWTRSSAELIGTVFLYVDYRLPLEPLRAELARIVAGAPEWDGRVQVLQVTDATERSMQLRALVSARDSSLAWDLRCRVREGLIAFINAHYPHCLPRERAEWTTPDAAAREPRPGERAREPAASTAAFTAADPTTSETGVPRAPH